MDLNLGDSGLGRPLWFRVLPYLDYKGYDIQRLRAVLSLGANVNARDKRDFSAWTEILLHLNAESSSQDLNTAKETLSILLDAGFDCAKVNYIGDGLIAELCRKDIPTDSFDNLMDLFLEHGADINARCRGHHEKGWTPLMLAIQEGHLDHVRSLLKRGADPKIAVTQENGRTALTIALDHGNIRIVDLLDRYGITASATDRERAELLNAGQRTAWQEVLALAPLVLENHPEDRLVLVYLCQAYNYTGDFINAEIQARQALELFPDSPLFYSMLLFALLNQNRAPEVITIWRKKLYATFQPTLVNSDRMLSLVIVAHVAAGKSAQSLRELLPLVAETPHPPGDLLFNAACLAARGGDPREALHYMRGARKEKKYQAETFDNEEDLKDIRAHPAYAIATHFHPGKLLLFRTTFASPATDEIQAVLTLREHTRKLIRRGKRVEVLKHPSDRKMDALVDYFKLREELSRQFTIVPEPYEEYWVTALDQYLGFLGELDGPIGGIEIHHDDMNSPEEKSALAIETALTAKIVYTELIPRTHQGITDTDGPFGAYIDRQKSDTRILDQQQFTGSGL